MDTAETLARRVSVSLKGRVFRGFPLRREFTFSAREESPSPMAVSYTHLTLPTIYSV